MPTTRVMKPRSHARGLRASLPIPDPGGRVVLVVGNGLRVEIRMGDVANSETKLPGRLPKERHRVFRPQPV